LKEDKIMKLFKQEETVM